MISVFKLKIEGTLEGYYADLAIIELNKPQLITRDNVLYKCGWSPFEDYNLPSSVYATILNGSLVYEDGKFYNSTPILQLEFDR